MTPSPPAGGTSTPTPADSHTRPRFAELAADAMRYWEFRRLFYNMFLAAVVMVHFVSAWPESRVLLTRDVVLGTFVLAVLANILYCAAYAVDLFAQFSALRAEWRQWRWILVATGTGFAATITHFVVKETLRGLGTR